MKKDERLLDLVTYLLNAGAPVQFRELQNQFPDEYGEGSEEAIARKFERDKADILELGIPLVYLSSEDEEESGYIIERKNYAMPALPLAPEELAMLTLAGSAVLEMESSPFTHDLLLALNKIGFAAGAESRLSPPRSLPLSPEDKSAANRQRNHLGILREAIASRKTVFLFYHSLWKDEKTKRKLDPYGLACVRGNWFAIGFCHLRGAIRVFHLDRITGLELNRFKPKSPDFDFPGDFRINDHVPRHPWEIRAHPPVVAVIRFEPPVAATAEVELGPDAERIEAQGSSRILHLRATFLDGLLPTVLWHRAKACVLSPPELVEKARNALRRLSGEPA